MEADPTSVDKITSFSFLFLHGIPVPPQIILQPIIDVILVNDTKMTQSIIGEIEYLEFTILCPHEIVFHDGDETLRIIMQAIQDVFLRYFIELFTFIEYEVDWFHFLLTIPIR